MNAKIGSTCGGDCEREGRRRVRTVNQLKLTGLAPLTLYRSSSRMEHLGRMTSATADVIEALYAADTPVWGLKVVKQTGRPAGSIYPILGRLERAGWATSYWDEDADRAGHRRHRADCARDCSPCRALASRAESRTGALIHASVTR